MQNHSFPSFSGWGCPNGIALAKELKKVIAGEASWKALHKVGSDNRHPQVAVALLPAWHVKVTPEATWSSWAMKWLQECTRSGRAQSLSQWATPGHPVVWGRWNLSFYEPLLVSWVFCHLELNAILFRLLRLKLCFPLSLPSNRGLVIHLWEKEMGLAANHMEDSGWLSSPVSHGRTNSMEYKKMKSLFSCAGLEMLGSLEFL